MKVLALAITKFTHKMTLICLLYYPAVLIPVAKYRLYHC